MDNRHSSELTPWQIVLPVLRQLSSEMDAGTSALARQDFRDFEKHVAAQNHLCDLLLETGWFGDGSRTAAAKASRGDLGTPPAVVIQLTRRMDRQKRLYVALLQRTQRLVQAVLAFHQSRCGYTPQGRVPIEASTWSSEV